MNNKLLRSELKNIVKECLVEILAEGLSGEIATGAGRGTSATRETPRRVQRKAPQSQEAPVQPDPRYANLASSLTSDPILSSVLAESQQTLSSQLDAERAGLHAVPGDAAAQAAANNDPMEIFGDASSHWAQLAFSEK